VSSHDLLIKATVIAFKAFLYPVLFHPNLVTSSKILLPSKVTNRTTKGYIFGDIRTNTTQSHALSVSFLPWLLLLKMVVGFKI
jgi:hypothetical protein